MNRVTVEDKGKVSEVGNTTDLELKKLIQDAEKGPFFTLDELEVKLDAWKKSLKK